MTDWSVKKAQETYNIPNWSNGYFDINEQGHVQAFPHRQAGNAGIDLYALTREIRQQGIRLPVLVRFTDILQDRVAHLNQAFHSAMQVDGYQGSYTSVYPIKVNQQHSVVEHIAKHPEFSTGLEAGSKPELMAVLGMSQDENGVIVCNGYKDREYIRLALIGQQMGHQVFIVIEKQTELELVIEESRKLDVKPNIGIRVRLASIGVGKWQNSGGEKSKFGLSAAQLINVVARLRQVEMLDSLVMLHFHLGSQLTNIRDIQRGMHECARYYAELHRMGAAIAYVDVGGGLGIDYEGSKSRHTYSTNYSMESYANNIVRVLWETCEQDNLPHPNIFTESGRAMTAHHAVLISNVIDTEQVPGNETIAHPEDDAPMVLHDLWACYQQVENDPTGNTAIETYHDVMHWLNEAQSMYTHGILSLVQRAQAEEIYYACCHRIKACLRPSSKSHRDVLDELNEKLADKYFCNFSLFQSLPDIWAIEQIFPIMPLHRLDEEPTRRGVLEDITCDSDGRIDSYVDAEGVESSLPLHSTDGKEYLLGIFLVGAYQEILGDMHNLFGDTDSVHVKLNDNGEYELTEAIEGDTVNTVLAYVHMKTNTLLENYRRKLSRSSLNARKQDELFEELEQGIDGYTYLED